MTKTSLGLFALLPIAAAALAACSALGVAPSWAVVLVPAGWLASARVARAVHGRWVVRRAAREGESGCPSRTAEVMALAARLHAASSGRPGFTGGACPLPALERAVLFPDNPGDEAVVAQQVARADPEIRAALVAGLRRAQDEAVDALRSPSHPLFLDAGRVLGAMGHPVPFVLGGLRAPKAWRLRRPGTDPERADEALAVRLIRADMPGAALVVLEGTPESGRVQRLRDLARLHALLSRGAAGSLALSPQSFATWAPELVLVVGRRLRELVPGSPFLAALPGGAAELERVVASTPRRVEDLALLHAELPDLAEPVSRVLARLCGRPVAVVRSELRSGELRAEPDQVLRCQLRGLALLDERRPREALAEFEAVVERAPDAVQGVYALAFTWSRLGQPTRGEGVLRQAVARNLGDVDARLLLARYLVATGQDRRARAVYEAAVDRFPRSATLRVAYAQQLMAWTDEDGARVHLELAHGHNPRDARLAFLAGRARVTGGRSADAVGPLEMASGKLAGRERAEAKLWLMWAYRDQNRHDAALVLVDEVLDGLGTGQEGLLEDLADYLEERHDFLRARAAADRARSLRGDDWR